jgi:hypothetical protein
MTGMGMRAFLVLLGALVPIVGGYSTGAGSCGGDGAPVAGKHLDRVQVTSGTLEAYNISVTLGTGAALQKGVPFDFEYGVPRVLTLSSSSSSPYRGFLIRLASPEGIDTTAALLPRDTDTDTQVAAACIDIEEVGGLTHTNSAFKSVSMGILEMDGAAEGLILDVTVVIKNAGFYSDFYYAQYVLNAVAPTNAPNIFPPTDAFFVPAASQGAGSPNAASPNAAPTILTLLDTAPAAAPAGVPARTTDNALIGLNAPAGAPGDEPTSGASSCRGDYGFRVYATLSMLVFSCFCYTF